MRALLCVALSACATLAGSGGGDVALPNALVGPFREITGDELGENRVAPYALSDDDTFQRDVAVIDADGAAGTPEAWFYAAANAETETPDASLPSSRILRFVAEDGRSPPRIGDEVLVAEDGWEGGVVGAPSVLRVGAEIWLFYEGAAGIGLARSSDGVEFTRETAPILSAADAGWDAGAVPRSPGVVALDDGSFHLFYEVTIDGAAMIGEARSSDGLSFERREAPALAPQMGGVDAAGAHAPSALVTRSAEGRVVEYLYYGADDGAGRAIALAARYDAEGSFSRAEAPVFASDLGPTEPWVVRRESFSLLFVTQRAGDTSARDYPAVAVGVAPADVTLP